MPYFLETLLSSSRRIKRLITITYDFFAILCAIYLAIIFRVGHYDIPFGVAEFSSFVLTTIISIFCFIRLGMYRAILRYMMLPALGHIFLTVFISATTLSISSYFFHSFIPRSVPFIYAGIALILLGGPRILIRNIYDFYYRKHKINVIIYGAGATGRDLIYALTQGEEYHPVAMLDDDPKKIDQIMCGIRVYPITAFDSLKILYQPKKLLLAINNINKGERLRLLERLSKLPIEIQSVPSVEDLAAGRAQIGDIKDLEIEDLLGREPVQPDMNLLKKNIQHKSVMITGAGGSIGSELARQILALHPTKIILLELNEYNLYRIDQELQLLKKHLKIDTSIITALGSVQNENRLVNLMTLNNVETVYHAAAYKHVPMVESNIIEGIRNNVFGTWYCANAAIKSKVQNFTLISTDKAVRPTNIMGATKRLAELVLQALADEQTATVFTIVRFGNVLGSSGSVVPLFKKQIHQGGPVTVTHPDIIRYFMLIPEAAQLVIQASAMRKNGQVFVLDMGEPVKIHDLAIRMIHLMGMKEYYNGKANEGDIEIRFTGLRPGEKLFEELLIGKSVEGTSHQKIMTANEEKLTWHDMQSILDQLDTCCHKFDIDCIKKILLDTPTGYKPTETRV